MKPQCLDETIWNEWSALNDSSWDDFFRRFSAVYGMRFNPWHRRNYPPKGVLAKTAFPNFVMRDVPLYPEAREKKHGYDYNLAGHGVCSDGMWSVFSPSLSRYDKSERSTPCGFLILFSDGIKTEEKLIVYEGELKHFSQQKAEVRGECRDYIQNNFDTQIYLDMEHVLSADLEWQRQVDDSRCFWCDIVLENVKVEVDHIMPTIIRNNNRHSNKVNTCWECNQTKYGEHPEKWREKIIKLQEQKTNEKE